MPEKTEFAAIYARYSSHSQSEQSIEGQLAQAHKYAAAHGYTVVHEYIDRAQSGRTDNRTEFQHMLHDTAKKQFSVLICWKIDRFGRSREEIAINRARCRKNGVRVEYVAETIPDSPEGVILEAMLEGMAEYYSLQLSQNVQRGLAESAAKAQATGGTRVFGYCTGPDKKLQIVEAEAAVVQRVFELFVDGVRPREILQYLNESGQCNTRGRAFSYNVLYRMLSNEKYCGVYHYRDIRIPDGCPRIVSDSVFQRAQQLLKGSRRAPSGMWNRTEYMLTGKLFCGRCGAIMVGECGTGQSGAVYNYYKCVNNKCKKGCCMRAVRRDMLERAVVKTIFKSLDDSNNETLINEAWKHAQAQQAQFSEEETRRLQAQLDKAEKQIANHLRAIEAGILTPETKERMDELSAQRAQLRAALAKRALQQEQKVDRQQIADYFYNLRKLRKADYPVFRQLVQTFVNSIYVFEDCLVCVYHYFPDGPDGGTATDPLPLENAQQVFKKTTAEDAAPPEFALSATSSTKQKLYELFGWYSFCFFSSPPFVRFLSGGFCFSAAVALQLFCKSCSKMQAALTLVHAKPACASHGSVLPCLPCEQTRADFPFPRTFFCCILRGGLLY